jgi:hypothetical protein
MNFSTNGWDETFKLLKGLFPDADITQDQYDIWRDDLGPMNQEDVRIAIKQHWREKNWKTPKLANVKGIVYQIKENRKQEFVSSGEDREAQEYEDQQIRLGQEMTLDRLLNMDKVVLRESAELARRRYSMLVSKNKGDDPRDWSIIFRAAVVYVMDGNGYEASDEKCTGELA